MSLFAGLEHVALAARDPKSLAEWYGRVLGFHTFITFDNGPQKPATHMIGLHGRGPWLEVIPADLDKPLPVRANTDPGFSHLAVTVTDFDAAVLAVNAAGAQPEGGERAAPYGSRVQFYRDPEGNLFHLLYRPSPLPLRTGSDGVGTRA